MLELTKEEESALKGESGETLQLAYRILAATGAATDADRLVPIEWAHVSGVNYNTIGDAGEEFLSKLSKDAKVANNFLTTLAVFSSLVLAERIVPIKILKGPPVSASWSSCNAVIRGGFTAFIVFIIP